MEYEKSISTDNYGICMIAAWNIKAVIHKNMNEMKEDKIGQVIMASSS